ncbi:MAG TPA: hypothetical protein VE621_00575 [Bryobacteraceae bacterium]|jgi:quercetin dioxygenase-like cupin family protein|nr:hypothetical protein [Bryobacteraceae bacterium]
MRLVLSFVLLCGAVCAQRSVPIENEHVRVLDVIDPPAGKGKLHEHPMNRVMVYLNEGSQRLEYADGRTVNLKFKPGEVIWSPKAGMHTSENVGGKPFRIVEVELKHPGKPFHPPAADPLKVAPNMYKLVLENDQVRVLRVTIPAHGKVPLHEHVLPRVGIFLQADKIKSIPVEGSPSEKVFHGVEIVPGGALKHAEENMGDRPVELILVEVK